MDKQHNLELMGCYYMSRSKVYMKCMKELWVNKRSTARIRNSSQCFKTEKRELLLQLEIDHLCTIFQNQNNSKEERDVHPTSGKLSITKQSNWYEQKILISEVTPDNILEDVNKEITSIITVIEMNEGINSWIILEECVLEKKRIYNTNAN